MLELADQLTGQYKKSDITARLLFIGTKNKTSSTIIELLTGKEFLVKEATGFSGALDMLYTFLPDVIIVDSCGNELTALEFCAIVKSTATLKKSGIIILSDREDEFIEMAAFNSGADDFILLPVKTNFLMDRIKILLNGK